MDCGTNLEALRLQGDASQGCFASFYLASSLQGRIGYLTAGTTDLTIDNDVGALKLISAGTLDLSSTGDATITTGSPSAKFSANGNVCFGGRTGTVTPLLHGAVSLNYNGAITDDG